MIPYANSPEESPKISERSHGAMRALPESRRSFRARLAGLARFMAVPILAGFNPVIYDRAQEQPLPPTPHLALDDADWTASHSIEGPVVVQSPLKEAFV
jgi:hypothetical protein